jgi:hypothetical protein
MAQPAHRARRSTAGSDRAGARSGTERRDLPHGEVVAQPQEADRVTVDTVVDGGVGHEFRHQVGPHGAVFQLAARAPACAEVASAPRVIGIGPVQPRREFAPYDGGQGCGAGDKPQMPYGVVPGQQQRGGRGQGPGDPADQPLGGGVGALVECRYSRVAVFARRASSPAPGSPLRLRVRRHPDRLLDLPVGSRTCWRSVPVSQPAFWIFEGV